MTKYPLGPSERAVFAELEQTPSSYRDVVEKLAALGHREHSSQIVIRTLEAGLLNAFDKNGKQITIQDRLRFDGVGEEYEV